VVVVKPKHIEWFYRGARTLRAVALERGIEDAFPSDEDWYLCPVCLDGLTIEEFATEQLSVEHVPPEALGGNELVLTCKKCNNDAGRHFDAEAHKQQRLWQFLSGQSQQPETARFTVGDITTRVEAHVTGQTGLFLMEVPKINNPADLERMEAHMRMLSETRSTDFRFTVTPQLRYFPDRARVSWIRTAYLAAFALFGWKYILQPALQPIREQLMNSSTITLPLLSMYDPNGDPGRHEIWAIKQPTEHRSLLVISGQQGVFLPVPNDPRSLEELARSLGARANEPVHYAFIGDMFPWPSRPEHLLDPAPVTT
jgi:HNH endonuclease